MSPVYNFATYQVLLLAEMSDPLHSRGKWQTISWAQSRDIT